MNRERIERQIKLAETALATVEKQLDDAKVPADQRRKQPKWRKAEADLRAVKRRLISVNAILAREAECAERKAAATTATAE